MKYKDPNTGELKDIYVKASDTLPIGTVVEYDGDTVPDGYEEVEDVKQYTYTMDNGVKLNFCKVGRIINCFAEGTATVTAQTDYTLTLDDALEPVALFRTNERCVESTSSSASVYVAINGTTLTTRFTLDLTNGYPRFSFTYVSANQGG